MPLDPNIAMSFQPAQVPTVNALVNQSAQGMQNILATERQREADQMVRQDRETANLTRALAPAMAAAFSDPSDAGLDAALSLVPEQYRESMAAQVSQLRGIRDPNRRKDVMRSALLQDEIGQALLAQLEPTANARLNADMAAQRAALDQRKLQLEEDRLAAETEAGRQPKVAFRETDAEGNVRMFDAAGNEIGMVPKAGKPAAVARETPDGVRLKPGEIYNEETGRVEAVKGSETYNKQKSVQATDYGVAKNALRELGKVKGVVSDLKNTTGYQKAMGTGTVMANMPNILGVSNFTGAYDFQTKYKNLKGSVATLGRAAASLQGKLGNMAVQEWKLVSDAIANLDLDTMDADVLDDQLNVIAGDILRLEAQVRDAYENEWGDTQFYKPLEGGGGAPGETPSTAADDDPFGIRGK